MNKRLHFLGGAVLVSLGLAFFYFFSAYGFERNQPLPIPSHILSHSSFFPKGNSAFCTIKYDNDSVAFYFDRFGAGDGIAVYMDPAQCGFDTATYPFKVTNVYFYLYDPGTYVWPVEIKVSLLYADTTEDTLTHNKLRPGTLIPNNNKVITIPQDSAYDSLTHNRPINLYLDTAFYVTSPFFLRITYTGTTDSAYPSLLMSDVTDRPDTNQSWLFWKGKYCEWDTAWDPIPGRAIMRVTGYPQAIDFYSCWHWKPKTAKAPSGLPDFDQYQLGSDTVALDAPTAAANELVWLNALPSITNPDSLIRLLSYYFHSNPSTGGGTIVDSIKAGLDSLFANYGLNLYDTVVQNPTFQAMSDSLEESWNIMLLVGLWQKIDTAWYRIGGHYVSMAGACAESSSSWLAISDPALDNTEAGAIGRILPPHDPHPGNHTLHNTKGFVSHDVYISDTLSVGPYVGSWSLKDFYGGNLPWLSQFEGQNFQPEQLTYERSYDSTENIYVVVEYAIMILEKPSYVEEEDEVTPQGFELFQCYPNPFNPVTSIRYTVDSPQSTVDSPFPTTHKKAVDRGLWTVDNRRLTIPPSIHTTLKIYNILGQKVRTLVDEPKTAGNYIAIWDGNDDGGKKVSSGIYFYQLKVGTLSQTKRMVLLK